METIVWELEGRSGWGIDFFKYYDGPKRPPSFDLARHITFKQNLSNFKHYIITKQNLGNLNYNDYQMGAVY